MTYLIYSQQQLQLKSIARLKQIYAEIGCTVEVQDKRCKDAWINAILTHQSTQLQKIDEQTKAQAELDQYISDQAQAIAPEELTTVEINFYHHEVYAGQRLIAYITYDPNDFDLQPWVVMVNGEEKFRANTWAICYRFIQWHHKDGTLPVEEAGVQSAGGRGETSPYIPAPSSTGNEIMAVIFTECEKYGLELLDDGVYRNDVKLGEVGCTDGHWWAIRTGGNQERVICDCAMDAVWWLSITETSSTTNKYLQNRPLEQLTSAELEQLFATAV
ncbi:MAG: hypothetical protein MET45_29840 [Nostoc sp. LLA-1]|nr:hypothetical protein [Cyanocohniella sp. LLY]